MASDVVTQMDLKRIGAKTYKVAWHDDWAVGPTVLGGCVVAQIHHTLSVHLDTDSEMKRCKQPDVLNLHLEFLRPIEHAESIITVTHIKLGAVSSTLQVHLVQTDKLRVIALASSTNFDVSIGPSVPTGWNPYPNATPVPKPRWDLIWDNKPDPHWLAMRNKGELMPLNRNLCTLYPRKPFGSPSYTYSHRALTGDMVIDAAYLNIIIDLIPDMGDTILNNNSMYDGTALWKNAVAHDSKHPGHHFTSEWTIEAAMKTPYMPATSILDIEYKRRLPKEGLKTIFMTNTSKMIEKGRLDTEVTASTENHELICVSRQLRLMIDTKRRYGEQPKPSL